MGGSAGRVQGSLYGYQKKRIANAVAWMTLNSRPDCKPLIFVATSPGFVDRADEPGFISKLTKNLKNGYSCEHYVWVREYTQAGYPHFHFVANIPMPKRKVHVINQTAIPFDPVKLSGYWSGLFGVDAKNSIRVGSKPNKFGRRKMYIENIRGAWYMSKYIGKSRSDEEKNARALIRSFKISHSIPGDQIEPVRYYQKNLFEQKTVSVYEAPRKVEKRVQLVTGEMVVSSQIEGGRFVDQVIDVATGSRIFENEKGELMETENIDWNYIGHSCYSGFKK